MIPTPRLLRYTRATEAEINLISAADELITTRCDRWIRAITINAPPSIVYRWLCQLTVAPYSFDAIDFPGRRSPHQLTPGAENLRVGQDFLIFHITGCRPDEYIAGVSRPEFRDTYGEISVSYSVTSSGAQTRLRANACVSHLPGGTGLRRLALAAGDKLMAGRQLRVLKSRAESNPLTR